MALGMLIEILRSAALSDQHGSFGALSIDGAPLYATCEQPWNNNLPDQSCIPVGDYELLPYDSPAHGQTVVFHNPALGVYGTPIMIPAGATGRSLCEIHNANWPFQLKGCVAVGAHVMDMPPNGRGVNSSVATLATLMQRWGDRMNLTATITLGP
jgi:hypothetical protein